MHPAASFGKTSFAPRDHLKPGRPPRNDAERAACHAEIARRYAKKALKNCSAQRRIAVVRLHDLKTLCRASEIPADDGWNWLTIAANHIAFIYRKPAAQLAAAVAWGRRFTPLPLNVVKVLAEQAIAKPCMPTADKLAEQLQLDYATRMSLGITTIGAIDCDKAKRAALRKKRNNAAKRVSRAKAGAVPHANSAERTKPWIKLGISRRTYYRKGLNGTDGTNSGTAHTKCVVVVPKQCHGVKPLTSRPRAGGPARVEPERAVPRLSGTGPFTISIPELRAMTLRRVASIIANGATMPKWRATGSGVCR
jgi:hypothetical protein